MVNEAGSLLSFNKDWWLPHTPTRTIEAIAGELSISPAMATILANRNLRSAQQALRFLNPSLAELHDPFGLPDMDRAVERILEAVRQEETIVIYGHDDVDGVTGVFILAQAIEILKGRVLRYIPDRVSEGTGLNWRILNVLAQHGARLIVTVDCSIEDQRIISGQEPLAADVIVTDHHEVSRTIHPSIPSVNPKRVDSSYPFRDLSGAGVSLKLAQALIQTTEHSLEQFFASVGDLVALGSISDKVSLIDENRIFARLGMDLIQSHPRPAIEAISGLFARTMPVNQAFLIRQVIPLLNSASSLNGQNDSLTLLGTRDPHEAARIVDKLYKASCIWQQQMEESFQRVLEKAHRGLFNTAEGIMVIDENAAPKTLGSIASRLIRLFSKAAFVLRYVDDRYFGEARAPRGCNLVELFGQCQDLLITYGGHKQAAGFSLFPECIEDFRSRLMELLQSAPPPAPSLWYLDCELPLSAIQKSFCMELDRLAPFGRGNANPYFLGRNATLPSWENRGNESNSECTGSLDGLPCTVARDLAGHCSMPVTIPPGRCDLVYQVMTSDGDPPHVTVRDLRRIG